MLRLAFDFIITWRETRTRPNAYSRKINTMMRAELHDLFDENKHVYGIDYINSAWYFLRKYCIESLSVEALLKDYQRWRRKMRRKTSVREYKHR